VSTAAAHQGDTLTLIAAAQRGDRAALDALIEGNSPLIWSVVRRFFGRGVEADDLYQLGAMGFLKAVQGFSSEFGTQFSTYAVPKIAGEVKRFLRDDGLIKVSRSLKENAYKVWAAREAFEKRHGGAPRLSDLQQLTGLSAEDIAACLGVHTEAASLDAPAEDGGGGLLSTLSVAGEEERMVEHIALRAALERLDGQLQQIILLRYFRDMTQQKTAQALGLSQVQVSRLERKAVGLIREMMEV